MELSTHLVAVAGLFMNEEGELLLVKTQKRGWECPGGMVESGEDLIEAMVREALEESRCEVEVERLVGVYSRVDAPEGVVFMFRGRHVAGSPGAANETVDAAWFSPEEALERVTNPPSAARLRDALSGNERPVYRAYAVSPYAVRGEWSL